MVRTSRKETALSSNRLSSQLERGGPAEFPSHWVYHLALRAHGVPVHPQDRQETGEDIGKTYSLCACASVHPWSILRVNGRIGAIDEFCTSHCKV